MLKCPRYPDANLSITCLLHCQKKKKIQFSTHIDPPILIHCRINASQPSAFLMTQNDHNVRDTCEIPVTFTFKLRILWISARLLHKWIWQWHVNHLVSRKLLGTTSFTNCYYLTILTHSSFINRGCLIKMFSFTAMTGWVQILAYRYTTDSMAWLLLFMWHSSDVFLGFFFWAPLS